MKIKKILVLGATGFVGSRFLLKTKNIKNYKVFSPLKKTVNLLNINSIRRNLNKNRYDYIVNCAADVGSVHYVENNTSDIFHNNILMNLNLYKAVKNKNDNSVIINIYSNCCYDGSVINHYENHFLDGKVHDSVFSYGNFKRTLYFLSKSYKDQYGLKSINLMFPSIYGPGDSVDPYKTHAMNGIIIRALKNKIIKKDIFEIWGSGRPVRNWLYIDDAINSIILSIKTNLINEFPINVVNDKAISINEIVNHVINKIDKNMKIRKNLNYSDGSKFRFLRPGIFKKKFPDFKYTNYEDGINRTILYYDKKIKIKKKNK